MKTCEMQPRPRKKIKIYLMKKKKKSVAEKGSQSEKGVKRQINK